jgi:hypothetical protein
MPILKFLSYSEEKVPTAKGSYQKMTVVYKTDRDETKTKTVMSFSNPAVYDAIKRLNAGDSVEVAYVEGDKFYNWASVKAATGSVESPAKQMASNTPARTSTYETPEERAKKQVYIIKQSCLAQAVATEQGKDVDAILKIADQFVEWVLDDGKDLFKEPNDL